MSCGLQAQQTGPSSGTGDGRGRRNERKERMLKGGKEMRERGLPPHPGFHGPRSRVNTRRKMQGCRAELTPREGQAADSVLRMLGAI